MTSVTQIKFKRGNQKMSQYRIHNDFKKLDNKSLPLYPVLLPLLNTFLGIMTKRTTIPDSIQLKKQKISGYQNGKIKLTIFEPIKIQKPAPCLVYFHGGGFVLKEAPYHRKLLADYAIETNCIVISVDYRLAPKYPFPTALEDCYAASKWTFEQADVLGIDKTKVAIGGDSAGGALAASVTLANRDRKDMDFCFQMLLYPVTDARQNTDSMKKFDDVPLWNAKLNKKMWEFYLKNGLPIKKEYASPMETHSFNNLPNAYVEVAEFDCLRDEGIHYAKALKKATSSIELNLTRGTIHGYDLIESSDIVLTNKNIRIKALQKAFN